MTVGSPFQHIGPYTWMHFAPKPVWYFLTTRFALVFARVTQSWVSSTSSNSSPNSSDLMSPLTVLEMVHKWNFLRAYKWGSFSSDSIECALVYLFLWSIIQQELFWMMSNLESKSWEAVIYRISPKSWSHGMSPSNQNLIKNHKDAIFDLQEWQELETSVFIPDATLLT